jgi:hypothetical protein
MLLSYPVNQSVPRWRLTIKQYCLIVVLGNPALLKWFREGESQAVKIDFVKIPHCNAVYCGSVVVNPLYIYGYTPSHDMTL